MLHEGAQGRAGMQTDRQTDTHTHTDACPPTLLLMGKKKLMPFFDTFHFTTFALLTPFIKDNVSKNVL